MNILVQRNIYVCLSLVSLKKVCDATFPPISLVNSANPPEKLVRAIRNDQHEIRFEVEDDRCRQTSKNTCLYKENSEVRHYFRRRGSLVIHIIGNGRQFRTLNVTLSEKTLAIVLSTEGSKFRKGQSYENKAICTRIKNGKTFSTSSQETIKNQANKSSEIFRFEIPLGEEIEIDPVINVTLHPSRSPKELIFRVKNQQWTCGPILDSEFKEIRSTIVTPHAVNITCVDSVNSEFHPISNYGVFCQRSGMSQVIKGAQTAMAGSAPTPSNPVHAMTLSLVIIVILLLLGILYGLFRLWILIEIIRKDLALLKNQDPEPMSNPLASSNKGSITISGEKPPSFTLSRSVTNHLGQEKLSPGTHCPGSQMSPARPLHCPPPPKGPPFLSNSISPENFNLSKSEHFTLPTLPVNVKDLDNDSTDEHDYDTVGELYPTNKVSPDDFNGNKKIRLLSVNAFEEESDSTSGREKTSSWTHCPGSPKSPTSPLHCPPSPNGTPFLKNPISPKNFDRRKSEHFTLPAHPANVKGGDNDCTDEHERSCVAESEVTNKVSPDDISGDKKIRLFSKKANKVMSNDNDSISEHTYDVIENMCLPGNQNGDIPATRVSNGLLPKNNLCSSRESINSLYEDRKKMEEIISEETIEI